MDERAKSGAHQTDHQTDTGAIAGTFTIRPALLVEAASLTDLALRAKGHWGYDDAFLEACRPALSLTRDTISGETVRVAECDGTVAGFYVIEGLDSGAPDRLPELDMVFVEPAWIGKGIGAALVTHAAAKAASAGARGLSVIADPHAQGFYEAQGFVLAGDVPSDIRPGRRLARLILPLADMRSRFVQSDQTITAVP